MKTGECMKRFVQPELLDELPPDDSNAMHSRRDMERLNRWMRNGEIVTKTLLAYGRGRPVKRLVEWGAGDGSYLLRLANRLKGQWPGVEVMLVDRQNLGSETRRSQFARCGWRATFIQADILEWLSSDGPSVDLIIANLFLHHFRNEDLQRMFQHAAQHTKLFTACEPARSAFSLLACKFLSVVGCNYVTRHDAKISVRAGFTNHELSALWPRNSDWQLNEGPAGLFSHLFVACHGTGKSGTCAS